MTADQACNLMVKRMIHELGAMAKKGGGSTEIAIPLSDAEGALDIDMVVRLDVGFRARVPQ